VGASVHKLRRVYGVEPVDVLRDGDGADHRVLVDVLGEGELNEDAVASGEGV